VVDVVLPVLDEVGALPTVIGGLPDGFRAIVVDNGSTDGSGDLARELGAEVVDEPRRGFGWACWSGLQAATAEVVAFMDADASLRGADLPAVTDPVVERRADLVLGRRDAQPGAWPWTAQLANRVLVIGVRRRAGVALRDLGPMRAARRTDLLTLDLRDRRFGWPLEMVLVAAARGWHVQEVPVRYEPRIGRSKVTGTVAGTWRATRDMAGVARRLR
jgi:glycosyltransferase involved in cell wall biosynthesis